MHSMLWVCALVIASLPVYGWVNSVRDAIYWKDWPELVVLIWLPVAIGCLALLAVSA